LEKLILNLVLVVVVVDILNTVRCQVLKAVCMNMVTWDIALCILVEYFIGKYQEVQSIVQAVYTGKTLNKHVCRLMKVINQDFYTSGQ
jgi:hypothetical protein